MRSDRGWLDQRETEYRCSKRLRQGYVGILLRLWGCVATFVLWKVKDTWRSRGWTEGDKESRFCRCFLLRDITSFSQRKRTLASWWKNASTILGRKDCVRGSTRCPSSSCECLADTTAFQPHRLHEQTWGNLSARGSLSAGISGVLWRTKRSVPDTLFGNSVPEIRFGEIAYNEERDSLVRRG